jgi:cation transport protein ChaC
LSVLYVSKQTIKISSYRRDNILFYFLFIKDCVYGAAYEISNEDEVSVRHVLDVREKDGYTIIEATFHPSDHVRKEMICFTYMAQSDNPFWGGDAPLDSIAEQIARAEGPSGSNREYLFKLVEAIRIISSANDEHLFALDQRVKEILAEDEEKITNMQ